MNSGVTENPIQRLNLPVTKNVTPDVSRRVSIPTVSSWVQQRNVTFTGILVRQRPKNLALVLDLMALTLAPLDLVGIGRVPVIKRVVPNINSGVTKHVTGTVRTPVTEPVM